MRRPLFRLMAVVVGSLWGWSTPGLADDFNPFEDPISQNRPATPLVSAPEPFSPTETLFDSPAEAPAPVPNPGEATPATTGEAHPENQEGGQGDSVYKLHDEEHLQPHEEHAPHFMEHMHEEEHEPEPLGNIRVTPLYRQIESGLFRQLFKNMYSVNVGTTFWQPEQNHGLFNTQVGFLTEFQYSGLNPRNNVNISSVTSVPFATRENLRVDHANLYTGNLGLSFAANTYLPDSCTKLELGFSPIVTIGALTTGLVQNTHPLAGQSNIFLDRGASSYGHYIGGDFRLWTGIKTQSGFRAGITGFYSVAETPVIYDVSNRFRTYGGGFFVEMPTRFVPHEVPVPIGTLQWIEKVFHLD